MPHGGRSLCRLSPGNPSAQGRRAPTSSPYPCHNLPPTVKPLPPGIEVDPRLWRPSLALRLRVAALHTDIRALHQPDPQVFRRQRTMTAGTPAVRRPHLRLSKQEAQNVRYKVPRGPPCSILESGRMTRRLSGAAARPHVPHFWGNGVPESRRSAMARVSISSTDKTGCEYLGMNVVTLMTAVSPVPGRPAAARRSGPWS